MDGERIDALVEGAAAGVLHVEGQQQHRAADGQTEAGVGQAAKVSDVALRVGFEMGEDIEFDVGSGVDVRGSADVVEGPVGGLLEGDDGSGGTLGSFGRWHGKSL